MIRALVVATSMLFLFATSGLAGEHPEHPTEAEKPAKAEHPERTSGTEMSLDELEKAIGAFILKDARLKGGKFLVFDPVDGKPLALDLVKVHKERLSSMGGGVYFACTDMKSADGVLYDLDFFMKKDERGVHATEVAVHKKAGNARYGWKEEGGIWKKVKS